MTGHETPWSRRPAIRQLLSALMLVGLAWLCSPSPAAAQTCTATATDMAFGVVQTANNSSYSTTATIQVSCTSYSGVVQLRLCPFIGGGTYVTGASGPRKLGFNEYRLDFDVFVTSGQAIRYPDDTTSASTPATIINVPNGGTPSTANIVIYGGIPANQTGAVLGAYSATLSSGLNYGQTSRAGATGSPTACTATAGGARAGTAIRAAPCRERAAGQRRRRPSTAGCRCRRLLPRAPIPIWWSSP